MKLSDDIEEKGLLLVFLMVSLYFVIETRNFPLEPSLFPLFAGIITIFCAGLLLFADYLPEPIRQTVMASGIEFDDSEIQDDIADQTDYSSETVTTAAEAITEDGAEGMGLRVPVALTTAYILLSYLVGFFWVTPFFVATYCIWARLPRHITALITGIGLALVWILVVYFNVPLDSGLIDLPIRVWRP